MLFLELFSFEFMRRALLAALCISIITPMIGQVIVLKRMSTVGDALSHTGLAGVAIGLVLGFNPIIGAFAAAICAGLALELIRRRFSWYAELSVSITLSLGVGLAAVFSGMAPGAGFYNFLFGSIVAISNGELFSIAMLSIIVVGITIFLYRPLLHIAFDEESAVSAGIPVNTINLIFTILTAVAVAISARTVGALIISSLMVIPVACAMQISRGYKENLIYSIMFAFLFTMAGLILSFYFNLRPGGAIVLIGIAVLVLLIIVRPRR
ncbi:MAG: metal ABC transporter permease [Defluviitaleaceae bacterium]|nr:metal ABC transporter permease [Defluviitaleaceae bacterium]